MRRRPRLLQTAPIAACLIATCTLGVPTARATCVQGDTTVHLVTAACGATRSFAANEVPHLVLQTEVRCYGGGADRTPELSPSPSARKGSKTPATVLLRQSTLEVRALASGRTYRMRRVQSDAHPGGVLYRADTPLPPGRYELVDTARVRRAGFRVTRRRAAADALTGACVEAPWWRPAGPEVEEEEVRTRMSWVDAACHDRSTLHSSTSAPRLRIHYEICRLDDALEEVCEPRRPEGMEGFDRLTLRPLGEHSGVEFRRLVPDGGEDAGTTTWGADRALAAGLWDTSAQLRVVDANDGAAPTSGRCAEATLYEAPREAPDAVQAGAVQDDAVGDDSVQAGAVQAGAVQAGAVPAEEGAPPLATEASPGPAQAAATTAPPPLAREPEPGPRPREGGAAFEMLLGGDLLFGDESAAGSFVGGGVLRLGVRGNGFRFFDEPLNSFADVLGGVFLGTGIGLDLALHAGGGPGQTSRLGVALDPRLFVDAGRFRIPSLLGWVVPGAGIEHRFDTDQTFATLRMTVPFAVWLAPSLGLELAPRVEVHVPLNGGAAESFGGAELSLVWGPHPG